MASTVALTLLTFLLVAAVAAGGIGVSWWAIFGDKARGRRRCPRCWHDLSRTPGLTCSECGHAARGEHDLARSRRRWGLAAGTLLAVAAVAIWAQSMVLNQGWPAYVPDLLLVRVPSLGPSGWRPRALLEEASDRLREGTLDADEVLSLAGSVVDAGPAAGSYDDPMARLVAAIADSRPEELDPVPGEPGSVTSDKDARRRAFDAARTALLDRLPPWIEAIPLARVPADGPGLVVVRGTLWGTEAEWRVREAGIEGPWLVGDAAAGLRRMPSGSVLSVRAAPESGRLRCELETSVRRRSKDGSSWGPWAEGPRLAVDGPSVAVELGSLQPVDDDETRAAAAACFDQSVVAWDDDEIPMSLRFRMTTFEANGFGNLLVGIRAEVLENGVPRRRSRLWWSGSSRAGWAIEYQDTPALRRLRDAIRNATQAGTADGVPPAIPGWTVRIASERATAARALPAGTAPDPRDAYWAGSVEVPVRGVPEPASRARRTFWFDPIDAMRPEPHGQPGELPDKSVESGSNR